MSEAALEISAADRLLIVDDHVNRTEVPGVIGDEAGFAVLSVNDFEMIMKTDDFNPAIIFLDLNLDPSDVFDDRGFHGDRSEPASGRQHTQAIQCRYRHRIAQQTEGLKMQDFKAATGF